MNGAWSDASDESLRDRPAFMVALQAMVPLYIHEWKDRPWPQRRARAQWCARIVASHGDAILYKSKAHRGRWAGEGSDRVWIEVTPGTGGAFAALAEGIALLALTVEGGVDVFGQHWGN